MPGQIITFTFPHIGNVGTNPEDIESINPAARGVVLRGDITEPANWRAAKPLDDWLKSHNLPGICRRRHRELSRAACATGGRRYAMCPVTRRGPGLPTATQRAIRPWPWDDPTGCTSAATAG